MGDLRQRAVVLLVGVFSNSVALASAPFFVGIGDLPGGRHESWAWGISADGSTVVGRSYGSSLSQAFYWNLQDGIQPLDGLTPRPSRLGDRASRAWATSHDGSVIVGTSNSRAVIWTDGEVRPILGVEELVPGPPELATSVAYDVSLDGSVVVGQVTGSDDRETAFLWTEANGIQDLGSLDGRLVDEAYGVSPDGRTVVGASGGLGFRWTSETGMVNLGSLRGGTGTGAYAASKDGSVIVGYSVRSGFAAQDGFRWVDGERMVGMGERGPGSYKRRESNDVSHDGSVIVGKEEGEFHSGAFAWTEETGIRFLDEVLTEAGLSDSISSWRLDNAKAVSADGLTIAGWGENPSGQREAWVARVPEPSSNQLLLLACVLTVRRWRAARRYRHQQ